MSEKSTKTETLSTINGSFTVQGSVLEVMNIGQEFEKFMKDIEELKLKIKHFRYDVNISEEDPE